MTVGLCSLVCFAEHWDVQESGHVQLQPHRENSRKFSACAEALLLALEGFVQMETAYTSV